MNSFTAKAIGIVGVFVLIVLFFIGIAGANKVEAGHVAAVTKGGKLVECRKPQGWDYDNPFNTKFHTFDVRQRTYELVDGEPGDSDSKAEYVDWNIDTNSKDGVPVSQKLIVKYHIDPDRVCDIFTLLRNDERVFENVVKLHVRAVLPQVIPTYGTDFLYFGNLESVSNEITERLTPLFAESGVVLDYFELKRATFSPEYTALIQGRAAELSSQELIKAQQETTKQQNEKDRLAAEGVANVQKIQAQTEQEKATIASNGVAARTEIDANAQAKKVKIDADAEANRVLTIAKASADATALQAKADNDRLAGSVAAYGGSDAYVQLEIAKALGQANVTYLPSDSIPLLNMILGDPAQATP